MTLPREKEYLAGLVRELCKLPRETEWAEFKGNNWNPEEIGEYISALANAAALNGKSQAYLLWGVDNKSHEIIGCSFNPLDTRKGNEPLESWLLRLLQPKIDFRFHEVTMEDKALVLLEIQRASDRPVAFSGVEYIRIGEAKKPLKEAPDRERQLWRIFDRTPFEEQISMENVEASEVLRLLDYPSYFDLLEIPLPAHQAGILSALEQDRLLRKSSAGAWDITNLGAILFAKRLSEFPRLKRKAMRVIQYRGKDRTESLREQEGAKGYASGFEGLIGYINGLLPVNEVIGQALRKTVPMFPELAVRELVANALIHQDFFVTGAGPMVEIFSDRVEITNPGESLVAADRFIDSPPRSRNEALASMMRRFRICEERGSGMDKVVTQIELYQLPAPLFEILEGFTRTVLFAHKDLKDMDKADRVRACYLHSVLKYLSRSCLTNTSLRERFGVEEHNRSIISRLISDAVDAGVIVLHDPDASPKHRKYIPHWAAPKASGTGESST